MTKLTGGLVALTFVALLGAPGAAQDKEVQTIALEKVLGNPQPFEGLTVTFIVQFHRLGRLDGPVFTKFEKDWYQNFSAWPDGAPLWDKDAYKKDYQYFFISRLSEGANQIIHAPNYSRWLITAEVSEIFNGKPWFEVKGLTQLETSLRTASLQQLVKGFRASKAGKYELAAKAFGAADAGTLPANIRLMAMNEEASALHAAGNTAGAVSRLEAALKVVENDRTTMDALTAYRAALGLDADGNPIPTPTTGDAVVAVPEGENETQPSPNKRVEKVTLDLVPEPEKKEAKKSNVANDNDNGDNGGAPDNDN